MTSAELYGMHFQELVFRNAFKITGFVSDRIEQSTVESFPDTMLEYSKFHDNFLGKIKRCIL
jgi:hypothetical protein